jgi:hypothetical protein
MKEALKLALEAREEYHYGEARIILRQALEQPEEQNFCPRCGKRTADLTTIHTCTPPIATGLGDFYGLPNKPISASNADGKCVTAGETAP